MQIITMKNGLHNVVSTFLVACKLAGAHADHEVGAQRHLDVSRQQPLGAEATIRSPPSFRILARAC
jgi:hypothetical protein